MKIKTVIVDDEPLARERLRTWLEREPDLELIAECGDGRQAVATIRRSKPDLVFLDVQMPELDGLAVLDELGDAIPPAVIFVTAYDQFAVKAFELHAVDYLLKPFDRERFQAAVRRALERLQRPPGDAGASALTELRADWRPPGQPAVRLAVKVEGRVLLIKTTDVDWIEAADNYVSLHVGAHTHLLRETMASIETRLDPARFLRISRSTIVNIEQIKELQPLFHGEHVVVLRDGTKLTLSRNYRDKLKDLGMA
jgi:two-component system, LytTR family, response regulator